MNRPKSLISALLLVLMHAFPLTGFSMPATGETVTQRDTVDDDYYAAGNTVDIDTVIYGDVVVADGDLFIGNHVKADLFPSLWLFLYWDY